MSFRPARFTDIHRVGPPTTSDGKEWSIRVSAQPPPEWLGFFDKDAGGGDGTDARRAGLPFQGAQPTPERGGRQRSRPGAKPHGAS